MSSSARQALALAIRRADRRVAWKIAGVAGAGVGFALVGPFALAPVCWSLATILYWRRGMSVLEELRGEPTASAILERLPVAKVIES